MHLDENANTRAQTRESAGQRLLDMLRGRAKMTEDWDDFDAMRSLLLKAVEGGASSGINLTDEEILEQAKIAFPNTPSSVDGHAASLIAFGRAVAILAEARIGYLEDKVDGLQADLDNAVETAYNRGATEWAKLNYPAMAERLARRKKAG